MSEENNNEIDRYLKINLITQNHKIQTTLKSNFGQLIHILDLSADILENEKAYDALDWFESIVENLVENSSGNDSLDLHVPDEHKVIFNYVISYLLVFANVAVYCEKCKKDIHSQEIDMKKWKIIVERMSGTGGKEFKCPEGHTVFKTTDWRS